MSERLRQALDKKSYAYLKEELARIDNESLRRLWPGISAFEKIILFKLLPAARALKFYAILEREDKSYLLSVRPLGCLGPVLEEMSEADARSLFHQMSDQDEEAMLNNFIR